MSASRATRVRCCPASTRACLRDVLLSRPRDERNRQPARAAVRALERLISILEAVADDPGSATTTSIASRVGLSLSTTSRLVRELEQEGLVERTYENGPYTLGHRFLALARSAIQPANLINSALRVMDELRDSTQETVSLHVRQNDLR